MKLENGQFFGRETGGLRAEGLGLSITAYRAGQIQPPHTHTSPTFFVLLAGDCEERTLHRRQVLRPLTIAFHPTGEPHSDEVGPRGMRGLNLELTEAWLESRGLRERELGGYRVLDLLRARLLAVRLVATCAQRDSRAAMEADSLCLEVLEFLRQGADPAGGDTLPWMRAAEALLRQRFRDPIGLSTLAAEFGLHPVYVARAFRRRHGCSVSDFLRALRLLEAARLMLGEGLSIAAAAHAAGFSDHPHMTRSFGRQLRFLPKVLKRARRLVEA